MELFLKNFDNSDNNILGIEPSKNVADIALKNNIPTINEFFNTVSVKKLKSLLGALI